MKHPRSKPIIQMDELYEGRFSMNLAIILAFLSTLLGCTMLLSNIAAAKVWGWRFLALDGGVFLFPVSYILGDVLVELFYKRTANTIAAWIAGINLIAYGLFKLVDLLPDAPGVSNIAVGAALGMSGQVMIASTIAFLISQRMNNRVYDEMRAYTHPDQQIWVRAWFSSVIARFLDTVIFTVIAFWGRMGIFTMFKQMACSFLVGMLIESLLTPFTVKIIRAIRHQFSPAETDEDNEDEDD